MKKKPRKREHSITMQTLSKRLAAYHAAVLEAHLGVLDCLRNSDIKTQGMIRDLTLRIDRALTALYDEKEFVDRLTEKLPVNGPMC